MSKEGIKLSRNFWMLVIGICSCLIVLVMICFIAFYNRKPEVIEKKVDGGFVTLNYTSEANALTLLKATPMTDEEGMKNMTEGQYFDFSIDVDVEKAPKVEYEVSIIKDENVSTIEDADIRIYLEKEEDGLYTKVFGPEEYVPSMNFTTVGSELGSMVLVNNKAEKTKTENYRLRMWLSKDSTVKEGSYSIEVDIHAIAK